tara:strand:- start:855 stop:2045 length:1191 start_codon:yes stop_codon:yes gene_type:complete
MPISERLKQVGSGVFGRLDGEKRSYRSSAQQSQRPLIDLSLGSSDLKPPPRLLQVMADAIAEPLSSRYCLQAATAPFRQAAAAWVQGRFGVSVDPDREILLLVGSQEGTAHLPLAVLNPGDHALVLDPSYPSHAGGVALASGELVRLPLVAEQGWRPAFEQLSVEQQRQLRLLVMGYPHNPTATTGSQDWLEQAMAIAKQGDAVLAHDNPYLDLALEGEAPALLRCDGWRERGIEFFSFSKGWCLAGFRLAFAVGAPALIEALARVKGVVDFNQSLALQAGAITALDEFPNWPRQLCNRYRQRRDRMAALLTAHGWNVPQSGMALYQWLPLPEALRDLGSEAAAQWLLQNSGVALTPGVGFGPSGEGWLRLALVADEPVLEQASARLRFALEQRKI